MRITLENEWIRAEIDTLAAAIESLVDKTDGTEHYWQYDPKRWPRRTSVCFPICGGLMDGCYTFEGKRYEMPMHGFLRERELTVTERTATKLTLTLLSDEQSRRCYPFDFRFDACFEVQDKSLRVDYRVTNTGDRELYYSTGSHSTYALPAPQSECRYLFAGAQHAGGYTQDNGLIHPQKTADLLQGRDSLPMDHLFDVASTIFENADLTGTAIGIGTKDKIFTTVESEGFEFVILWAPKGNDSPFACIEPWAGMADFEGHDGDLTHKRGIQRLQPNQQRTYRQRITLGD